MEKSCYPIYLFVNWEQIYTTYKDLPEEGFSAKNVEDFCENPSDSLMHCFQPMTVLEKPICQLCFYVCTYSNTYVFKLSKENTKHKELISK